MSVADSIGPGTGTQSIDVYNLTVNGEFSAPDTFKGSARYNIFPQPPNRQGNIDGYLIYPLAPAPPPNDVNGAAVPFNTGAPQFGYDYATPGVPPQFELTDAYTLTCLVEGDYIFSFSMTVVGAMPCSVIFQLLGNAFPFTVGAVPPVLSAASALSIIPLTLPPPYTGGFGYNGSCNVHATPGQFFRVCYITSAPAEISLTSNLSIVTIQET
jgi:hypothetical protein